MSEKFSFVLAPILLVVVMVLVHFQIRKGWVNRNNQLQSELHARIKQIEAQHSKQNELYRSLGLVFQSFIIEDQKVISLDNDTTDLKDLVKQNSLLYIYPSNGCNDCFKQDVELLKKHFDEHSSLLLISDFENTRQQQLNGKRHELKFGIYRIIPGKWEFEYPFFAVVRDRKTMEFTFSSTLGFHDITQEYLLFVKKQFLLGRGSDT